MQNTILKNIADLRADFRKDNYTHILAIKAISLQFPVLSCNRRVWDNIGLKPMKEKGKKE